MPAILAGFMFLSCGRPIVRNAPKGQYFLHKTDIKIQSGKFSKAEKTSLIQRMYGQLDEKAKLTLNRKWIFFKTLESPEPFDSSAISSSSDNMRASLFHLGFYHGTVIPKMDSSHKRIKVTYNIDAGNPTIISAIDYQLKQEEFQKTAEKSKNESYLKLENPITKAAVITETSRLVDSFRNLGYYKFTAAELKVRGDTNYFNPSTDNDSDSTSIILKELARKKYLDSPFIRITVELNNPNDSSRLRKYKINQIYLISDFRPGDGISDSSLHTDTCATFIHKYHEKLFNNNLLERNLSLKPGHWFSQNEFYQTIYQFSKIGIWQTANIQVVELKDSSDLLNLIVELSPTKKYGYETTLEVSYAAASNTSNVLAGNLFGLSGNLSLQNRNLGKGGIRMTHNIRAGIEFNNNTGTRGRLINSNEISYGNTTSFPKLLFPSIPKMFSKNVIEKNGETFINVGVAYNTRLNLFNLHSVTTNFGWSGVNKKNWKWSWSPINIGFSNLFNQTDSFKKIVTDNPFLKFSYTTALVGGMGIRFSKLRTDLKHPNSLSKELAYNFNAEESGLSWGLLPVFNKYKRRYIKSDIEVKYTTKYNKTTLALRGFVGVGVPLLGSDTNRALPFFKQYFGGGSNSMRAWPVRGIGPGGRPLIPYSSTNTIFNDRTGDMQIEMNAEYRFDIARIIPNTLTLRGAVFTDIGNIWNVRSTDAKPGVDTSQFQLKNLYRQLGVSAGTGFRLDFNYFVLRLDLGFRFKRPELYYRNDGWKAPDIGFNDVLKKLLTRGNNDEYKKWRYENFNFSLGIGYAF